MINEQKNNIGFVNRGKNKPVVSRRKLSEEQVIDRLTMYEEAAQHLELSVHETIGEEAQAKIVAAQIRSLAKKFGGRFYGG